MEDQLPTPLLEIIVLHLYISLITLLAGLITLFLIMKAKNIFSWKNYIIKSIILLLTSIFLGLLIWQKWPFEFDIMFGPLNLPTLISLLILLGLPASMKNTKSV